MDYRQNNPPSDWNRGFWLPPGPCPRETTNQASQATSNPTSTAPERDSTIRSTVSTPAA